MKKLFKSEKSLKVLIVTLIVAMVALGSFNISAFAQQTPKNANDGTETTAKTPTNDETVYVLAKPNGTEKQIIVSEDGTLHYEGYEDCKLPVTMKVTYKLDGDEIKPSELAGKSGHVNMTIKYTNHEKYNDNIYVPFMAITGIVLDNEYFSNVDVTNAKIVDDGNRNLIVGYAFPGMQDSLGISKADFDVPESITISADVDNFQIETIYTLLTNQIFDEMDLSRVNSIGDLKGQLDKLESGVDQLLEGTQTLYEGTEKLQAAAKKLSDGTTELKNGSDKLYSGSESLNSGIKDLNSGLDKLSQNSQNLNGGAKQVFDASIKTADAGLADLRSAFSQMGKSIPTLTADNYSTVLTTVIQTLQGIEAQQGTNDYDNVIAQLQSAKTQLDSMATFYNGVLNYTAGVDSAAGGCNKLKDGSVSLVNGAKELSIGLGTLQKGEASMLSGVQELNKGAKKLNDGVEEMSDKALKQLSNLNTEDLAKVFDRIQTLDDAAKSYNSFGDKGSYNSVKFIYKTDEISPK